MKAVIRIDQSADALASGFVELAGDKDAVALLRPPSYPAAQLMELRQTEPFGLLDEHDRGIWHIDANLDDGGRNKNVDFAFLECVHYPFFLVGRKPAMKQ